MIKNKLVEDYIHFSYHKVVTGVEVFVLDNELTVDFDICNGKGTVRTVLRNLPIKHSAINQQISNILFEKPNW